MTLIYLDIETTGLDPLIHDVVEIAFAVDNGPIHSGVVEHSLEDADLKALEINQYYERGLCNVVVDSDFEHSFREAVHGCTIVGANPAFDTSFLRVRWGCAPWKYRLLDIEAYAVPVLGFTVPKGLAAISDELRKQGFDIPEPDHSAEKDVEALRACHTALGSLAWLMREAA